MARGKHVRPWPAGWRRTLDAIRAARLHVIDNFVWQAFMAERSDQALQPGGSFQAALERNLAPKRELLEIHVAALPDDASSAALHAAMGIDRQLGRVPTLSVAELPPSVEIAFIDGAKSWGGLLHLMRALGPRLDGSPALLVFQDFKYWAAYWVPLLVAMLTEVPRQPLLLVRSPAGIARERVVLAPVGRRDRTAQSGSVVGERGVWRGRSQEPTPAPDRSAAAAGRRHLEGPPPRALLVADGLDPER